MSNKLKLEDVEFIGGGSQFFEYEVFDQKRLPLDLQTSEIKWTLCNMGQKESPILIKGNKSGGGITIQKNVFTVELTPDDTLHLYDLKYEQEPIIIQPNGKVLRPNYGYFEIRKGSEY